MGYSLNGVMTGLSLIRDSKNIVLITAKLYVLL